MTTKIGTGNAAQPPRKDPSTLVETHRPAETPPKETNGPRRSPREAEHGARPEELIKHSAR